MRIVSLPTSGTSTSGRTSSKTRSSARKVRTVRGTHQSSDAAAAGPVRPVDVANVREVVGLLDPPDLGGEVGGLAGGGGDVAQAAGVDSLCAELLRRCPRDGHVRDLVPVRAQLLADARVELALVGLQRCEQEPHRHPVSSGPANSRYTASWRCANSSQVKSAARSGPPAGAGRAPRRSPARCSPPRWGRSTPRHCRRPRAARHPRDGHRAAARHRLQRRQPEALVEAREDERGGGPVELDEPLVGHPPQRRDALGKVGRMIRAREHEPQVGPLPAHRARMPPAAARGSCAATSWPGRGGTARAAAVRV